MSFTALKTTLEGALLKTGTGEILRENYQFANCASGLGTSVYLRTKDNLGITNGGAVGLMGYIANNGTDSAPGIVIKDTGSGSDGNNYLNMYVGGGMALTKGTFGSGGGVGFAAVGASYRGGRNFYAYSRLTGTSARFGINNTLGTVTGITDFSTNPYDYFLIGYGYFPGVGFFTAGKFANMFIYNRVLTDGEVAFMYNNLAGNEPLTKTGLIARWDFQIAEELDFSTAQNGSDLRVGVRDNSGGINHLYFVGLPAGTNAAKITYANANYFTNFI